MRNKRFLTDGMARRILLGLTAATVGAIAVGLLVEFLWNETIAALFGAAVVSFWQALGLFILAKLFFGFGGATRRLDRRRAKHATAGSTDGADDIGFADDAQFRVYWQAEGKQAYEAFRAAHEDDFR
jgi:hypothetical protein